MAASATPDIGTSYGQSCDVHAVQCAEPPARPGAILLLFVLQHGVEVRPGVSSVCFDGDSAGFLPGGRHLDSVIPQWFGTCGMQ